MSTRGRPPGSTGPQCVPLFCGGLSASASARRRAGRLVEHLEGSAMIEYVKKLAVEMAGTLNELRHASPNSHFRWNIESRFRSLAEELDRLDPRDFLPDAQFAFVHARRSVRVWNEIGRGYWAHMHECIGCLHSTEQPSLKRDERPAVQLASNVEAPDHVRDSLKHSRMDYLVAVQDLVLEAENLCKNLATLLDSFAGDGSRAQVRSFAFVKDANLRPIIVRDYDDLSLRLFPSGAWKGTVVLAGSILEAILHDQLTVDPGKIAQAEAAWMVRKNKTNAKKLISLDPYEQWTLQDYIGVAIVCDVIPADRGDTIDRTLRDYRNFIHPRREVRAGHPCLEAEAQLAKGATGRCL
jgi:hypothetical protein